MFSRRYLNCSSLSSSSYEVCLFIFFFLRDPFTKYVTLGHRLLLDRFPPYLLLVSPVVHVCSSTPPFTHVSEELINGLQEHRYRVLLSWVLTPYYLTVYVQPDPDLLATRSRTGTSPFVSWIPSRRRYTEVVSPHILRLRSFCTPTPVHTTHPVPLLFSVLRDTPRQLRFIFNTLEVPRGEGERQEEGGCK